MLAIAKKEEILSRLWLTVICAAAVLLVLTVSAVGTATVSAYNNTGNNVCNWSYDENTTLEIPYSDDPQFPATGDYAVAWSTARANWDAAAMPADFDYDGSQQSHTVGATEMGLSAANGVLNYWCWNFGKRSATRGLLNKSTLTDEDATFKRSTASHELGHYIGLRHSTVNPSIMHYSGNFYDYGVQKQDDECGVQDTYPHDDYPLECND